VQQLAGVHNLTATRCLGDLEKLGLLRRRTAGRAYLYSLKRSHRVVEKLIDPLFEAEQTAPQRFFQELGKVLKGRCLSAIVYGSVARGKSDPGSDVDLLVVVENEQAAEQFSAATQGQAEQLVREGWGLMLEVNIKTRHELRKLWNGPLLKQIRRDGQLVTGKPLTEVRNGRKS